LKDKERKITTDKIEYDYYYENPNKNKNKLKLSKVDSYKKKATNKENNSTNILNESKPKSSEVTLFTQ